MEDWLVKLLPDASFPMVVIIGVVLIIVRGIGFLLQFFRPALAGDIKEISRISEHLDKCVDEVKAEVSEIKREQISHGEELAYLKGTIERRRSPR